MKAKELQFTEMDINQIHELIFNSLGISLNSDIEIINIYNRLPDYIKNDFIKWGYGDTPTRDNAYEWYIDNKFKI